MVFKSENQTILLRTMFPFDLETTHEAKKLILELLKAKLEFFENQKNRKSQNSKDIQNQDGLIDLELDDNVLCID